MAKAIDGESSVRKAQAPPCSRRYGSGFVGANHIANDFACVR